MDSLCNQTYKNIEIINDSFYGVEDKIYSVSQKIFSFYKILFYKEK